MKPAGFFVKPKGLRKKGSEIRNKLNERLMYARKADRGKGHLPYNTKRSIQQIPFGNRLILSISKRVENLKGRRKIQVLEKGAGEGNTIAFIKKINPEAIETTALSATFSYSPENRPFIDRKLVRAGVTAKHGRKYDVIFDAFGEDYHLPKELVGYSIGKTISLLKNGGEAFTILPLSHKENRHALHKSEGMDIIKELQKREDIEVSGEEIVRRFERIEYTDLVIHIIKK